MSNTEDIYTIMRLLAEIDEDHLHAANDPQNPRHREARRCYEELTDWLSLELNKTGSRDYMLAPRCRPPPLRETRPGFCRNRKLSL